MEIYDLKNRFTYHPPKDTQPARYEFIREECLKLAETINNNCPDSREKSIAFTKLEEVSMWSNASIARNE